MCADLGSCLSSRYDMDFLSSRAQATTDRVVFFFMPQTWEYQDSWKYCVDYLGKDDNEFDHRHRFRVCWSIPTRRKPIPRATACVYFTFEVSKIKPKVQ